MLENAKDARERAVVARGANQLVNETAAAPLIAAVEQGEMNAAVATERLDLVPAFGLMGHIYDAVLADALDAAGHRAIALGVRKLLALGFNVAATVQEIEGRPAGDADAAARAIAVQGLRLGFAAAEELDAQRLAIPVLLGVVLPPAHDWRRRAAAVQAVREMERRVLALIAHEVERGASRCRIDTRKIADGRLQAELAERLLGALRARGFEAEFSHGGAQLGVRWDT